MKKFLLATNHRASDGALGKLKKRLLSKGMLTEDWNQADYVIIPGDRLESYAVAMAIKENNGKIIHLWAGEISQGTFDEFFRWSITRWSVLQLCTNNEAKERVREFFNQMDCMGRYNCHVVGNVMLDNMPDCYDYDVVLYNPPTLLADDAIREECCQISGLVTDIFFWLPPNGDRGSEIVEEFSNTRSFDDRNCFLALVKHCRKFISNSSCIDYEIKHIIPEDRIVRIGERNKKRESMQSDMTIPHATDNIIKILEEL